MDRSPLDAALANLQEGLDQELADLQFESAQTLAWLRKQLWSLGLGTRTATHWLL